MIALGWFTAGMALLIVGAELVVRGGSRVAARLGVSPMVVGITVVAIGTSTPELVTAIVSPLRKDRDIAVGNLLGSSVYNIVFILGVTCLVPISGLSVEPNLVHIDIPVMTAVTLVCVPVFVSGRRITRPMSGARCSCRRTMRLPRNPSCQGRSVIAGTSSGASRHEVVWAQQGARRRSDRHS